MDRASRHRVVAAVACAGTLIAVPGCIIGKVIGGMAESARLKGSSNVPAEYTGLADKSFAVVVGADRMIQADEPWLAERIIQRVNDRLMARSGAAYAIPSADLIGALLNAPQWQAMQPGEVAEYLGVERLVWIELGEYRLTEAGNQHVWDGLASGVVRVYAADGPLPDDPMFEKEVQVRFPDSVGLMQGEVPESLITTALSNRFVDRVAWLFYEHEEPNDIKY